MSRRIGRDGSGGYRLRLPAEERDVLRGLPAQLRELLQTSDPSLERLFPPAYDDTEADDEYGELVRGDLLEGKLAALEVVEQTVDADRLTEEQLEAWLGALESLRLVLGTKLDVSVHPCAGTRVGAANFEVWSGLRPRRFLMVIGRRRSRCCCGWVSSSRRISGSRLVWVNSSGG